MVIEINDIGLLLAVTTVVALICERFRLQYTVGLVLSGLALAMLSVPIHIPLSKSLLYVALLPPLVFEVALRIRWSALRRNLPLVLVLAGPGLGLSAAVIAGGMHYFVGWSWAASFLFGILISATDPVAVVAAFDEAKVHGRVDLIVKAESLANDGTAAAAFAILLPFALGAGATPLAFAANTGMTIAGGVLCGLAVALGVLGLAGRTSNHLVELTLTTLCAYGSFLVAEHIGGSGVIASLTAGLVVAVGISRGVISKTGQTALFAFWEYAAFLANSIIFILIGLSQAKHQIGGLVWPALITIILTVAGRAAAVYPFCFLFRKGPLHFPLAHQHVLFWGGLRGALALALVLGLPPEIPERQQMITLTFAVVAFSVFVQTLSLGPLLRRWGLADKSKHDEHVD